MNKYISISLFLVISASLFQLEVSAQWVLQTTPLSTNYDLYDVHAVDVNYAYAVGTYYNAPNFEGYAIRTNDGGANWYSLDIGTTPGLRAVYFVDSQNGYAVGSNGTIIKTIDGGLNWVNLVSGISNNLESVFFTSSTVGYACGEQVILKTVDSGNNWAIQSSSGITHSSIYFTSVDTGFISGFFPLPLSPPLNAYILKTTDAGSTWNIKYSNSNSWLFSVNFPSANVGYAGGFGLQIKTTDGGENWNTLSVPSGGRITSNYFIDENTGFVVGHDYGVTPTWGYIVKTTDGGASWTKLFLSTNVFLNDVHFLDVNKGYVVGDRNEVHKTTNGGLTSINNISSNPKFQIIPNPTSSHFTIEGLNKPYNLTIYNSLGQLLYTENNILETSKIVDVSKFKSGLIFIRIESDGEFINQKILKK